MMEERDASVRVATVKLVLEHGREVLTRAWPLVTPGMALTSYLAHVTHRPQEYIQVSIFFFLK